MTGRRLLTSHYLRLGIVLGVILLLFVLNFATAGSGIKAKTAQEIVTQAKAAMLAQKTVEIIGDLDTLGMKAHVDLKSDVAGTILNGTVTANGGTMTLILVNQHRYMTMDQTMAKQLSGGLAVDLLAGKCIDYGDTGNQSLGNPVSGISGISVLSQGNLIDSLFKGKSFTKGTVKTIDGTEVLPLVDSEGELDIATQGDALPVQVNDGSRGGGALNFSNWGKPVKASAPSGCVGIQELMQQMGQSLPSQIQDLQHQLLNLLPTPMPTPTP